MALLGSTGNVGRQTLDVLGAAPERFDVVALAAGTDHATLATQATTFRPQAVALADGGAAERLKL
ncbi:MAG: hypothetical protein WKF38_05215, partial [Candidatus Limnocylindrales bacterium]